MPIMNIDHYLVAPRSQEASQVKQQDHGRVPHEQGVLQIQSEQQERRLADTTVQTTETEMKEERYDAREKGKGTYERRDEKRRKQEEDEKKELRRRTGVGGSFFDVQI